MERLRIKKIEKTTKDCSIITFDVPVAIKKEYSYKQGQYLTLEAIINNEAVRRSYSLCSSPLDQEWQVGIKKIEGGKFSTYANDVLKVGDEVKVDVPNGHFFVESNPEFNNTYVLFTAGSGITPILSIIKTHLIQEPHAKVKLFYANRTVSSIILKEELEAIKNQFMDRFELFYFLTRQSRNMPLFDGRITKDKLNALTKAGLLELSSENHYFSCGPQSMVFDVQDYLKENGVDEDRIHFELFNTSGPSEDQIESVKQGQSGKTCEVTVIEGGKTLVFDLERGSDNILDAALANNADLPYACKGGVCSTCRAKIISGDTEMLLSYGLEQDEIDAGYVLTCQTWPMSDKVTIDFDS